MRTIKAVLLLAGVAAAAPRAAAQNPYTWTNTTPPNWNDSSNWLNANGMNGVPPSAITTQLLFTGAAAITANNDLTTVPFVLNTLTVSNTAATTISGNALSFAGASAALTVSAGAATVSNALTFSANSTVTNTSGNLLMLSGAITYAASTTTTYAGSASITASAAQTFGAGAGLTYTGSGTMLLGPTTGTGITFGNNTTITNSGSGTLRLVDGGTFGPTTAVTVNLANTGTGLFQIGNFGGVSGTGAVNITAGKVSFFGDPNGDLISSTTTLVVAAGATFDFNGNGETFGSIGGAGTLTSTSNLTLSQTGTRTFSGNIDKASAVT